MKQLKILLAIKWGVRIDVRWRNRNQNPHPERLARDGVLPRAACSTVQRWAKSGMPVKREGRRVKPYQKN